MANNETSVLSCVLADNGYYEKKTKISLSILPGEGIESSSSIPVTGLRRIYNSVLTSLNLNGYKMPQGRLKVTFSPIPDIPAKKFDTFTLPIALAVLNASGQERIPGLTSRIVVGALGLAGNVVSKRCNFLNHHDCLSGYINEMRVERPHQETADSPTLF